MDPKNPREDPKVKFGVGHHLRNGAGGEPRLEAIPKNLKNDPICQGHCATIHHGNKVVSVHGWTQPTQQRTIKSNWVWVITSTMELEVNQALKPSAKVKK